MRWGFCQAAQTLSSFLNFSFSRSLEHFLPETGARALGYDGKGGQGAGGKGQGAAGEGQVAFSVFST